MARNALLAATLERMQDIDAPNQVLGRTQTIGCVAVEITQRCNLDCTLCYLSEHSESVRDIPFEEVLRRLDAVVEHYGKGVHVQITGGDPTLRKHTELVEIVRHAADIGLYPALFTNGIGATRKVLEKLAAAGLSDIAFHVDSTQRRKGYGSEVELNGLREEYLERARGLGLMVIFNTTVHNGNRSELPVLIDFFLQHADEIGLASFNLQAETGRGEWGSRSDAFGQHSVRDALEAAAGSALPWDAVRVGHADCHTYMPTLVVNGRPYPVADDAGLVGDFIAEFDSLEHARHMSTPGLAWHFGRQLLLKPHWWGRAARYLQRQLWRMWPDLRVTRQAHKLTFFIQNFMDAKALDMGRVKACSFMVMTADGPVSMCEHNARRDEFILKPLEVAHPDGTVEHYQPLVWREQAG